MTENGSATASKVHSDAEGIQFAISDQVLTLTLNNPEQRNSQTPAFWQRLASAEAVAAENGSAVLVIQSEGKSFSAGLDRRMFTPEGVPGQGSLLSLGTQDAETIVSTIAQYQECFAWLPSSPVISIAAVQGHAVGAGFQLALACDLIVCADDAQFSMKEAAYGLVPDLTGTRPLFRAVGPRRALELCTTTRWLHAQEAVTAGLAVDAVPAAGLAARVADLVGQITATPPGTASEIKALLRGADGRTLPEQLQAEREAQSRRLAALRKLMGG